jgi:hypothetical protein
MMKRNSLSMLPDTIASESFGCGAARAGSQIVGSSRMALIASAIIGLIGLSAVPARAAGNIPFILGPALDYRLIGAPLVASGGPAPINPGVLVGLNPQPLPPFPAPDVSLNLSDPGGPVYTLPPLPGLQLYMISWGMDAGGPVSFQPPHPAPGDPLQYMFTGNAQSGDIYTVTFTLGGFNPGSFVELNPQPLPPFPDPGFGFVEFGLTAGGVDPTLTFNVTSGNTTFGFSPAVPEPDTDAMLLAGLGLLGFIGRRKKRQAP